MSVVMAPQPKRVPATVSWLKAVDGKDEVPSFSLALGAEDDVFCFDEVYGDDETRSVSTSTEVADDWQLDVDYDFWDEDGCEYTRSPPSRCGNPIEFQLKHCAVIHTPLSASC